MPLMALAAGCLFAGLLAGLSRLGFDLGVAGVEAAAVHGSLMIGGFFGTLISLERAAALGRRWAWLAPAASGAGGLLLLAGPGGWGAVLIVLGSIVLLAASVDVFRRQPALFTGIMVLGAACWLVGNLLWLSGAAVFDLVAWWVLFLVLTIAAERLELTRMLRSPRWGRMLFPIIVAALISGAVLSSMLFLGAGFAALGLWLVRFDVARRTIRQAGLPRYTASCLLSGYGWLCVGGLMLALVPPDAVQDAALHAILLGFVFAMVFGHAPIIFPALLRLPLTFTPYLYLPLALLHASLALRLAGGLGGWYGAWQWGGAGNAAAILLFITIFGSSVAGNLLDRRPARRALRLRKDGPRASG